MSHPVEPSRQPSGIRTRTKEVDMTPRLDPFAAAPAPMRAWLDFGKVILRGGLEDGLMELVKIRASQINGCAACLHMHTAAARERGEAEERITCSTPGVNRRSTAGANAP